MWGKGKGKLDKPINRIQHYHLIASNEPGHSKLTKCQGCNKKEIQKRTSSEQQACIIGIQKETKTFSCELFNKTKKHRWEKEPEIPIEPFSLESNFRDFHEPYSRKACNVPV